MKQIFCMGVALWGLLVVSTCMADGNRSGDIPGASATGTMTPSGNAARVSGERPEPTGEISLDDAVLTALERHPALAAAGYAVRARASAARQAGALPNPRIFTEIDQFGGTGEFSGQGMMESTFGISQEIPLGGKISKSRKVADIEVELAGLDRMIAFLELRKTVQQRFLRVYALQETLELEKKNLELLAATHDTVGKRVLSGDVSPLDQSRSEVELAAARADVEVLERDLEAARFALSSCWGSRTPRFTTVRAEFPEIPEIPGEDELLGRLERSPRYRQMDIQVSREKASLELAKANSWPDVEVGGAYRRFNEPDERAWLLELSLPAPLFNRSREGIREARQTLNKTVKEKEAGLIELSNSVIETAKRMRGIRAGYLSGREILLPAADRAFQAVSLAYGAGERNYLELLDAQRTRLKVQRAHVERLVEYLELKSELDALVPDGDFPPDGSEPEDK